MPWFLHFDFKKCFAPQRRGFFRHLNFQNWCENVILFTLWLGNVLRTSSHHNSMHFFLTSQHPKVIRSWCVLHILTSKCASCHIGGHFFDISISKGAQELRFFQHLVRTCASHHTGLHFSPNSVATLKGFCR